MSNRRNIGNHGGTLSGLIWY